MDDTTYRVYPYRWAVLASFMLVNLMIQALWIDFSPIMRDAAAYYGVGELAIGFLAMLSGKSIQEFRHKQVIKR